jgi:hypothetical protein
VLLAKRGELAAADHHLRVALAKNPQSVELLNDVGYCCYLQGRHDEAEAAFRQSLEIDPNHVTSRNNLNRVLSQRMATSPAPVTYPTTRQEPAAPVMATAPPSVELKPEPRSPALLQPSQSPTLQVRRESEAEWPMAKPAVVAPTREARRQGAESPPVVVEPDPVASPAVVAKPAPFANPAALATPPAVAKAAPIAKPSPVAKPAPIAQAEPVAKSASVAKATSVAETGGALISWVEESPVPTEAPKTAFAEPKATLDAPTRTNALTATVGASSAASHLGAPTARSAPAAPSLRRETTTSTLTSTRPSPRSLVDSPVVRHVEHHGDTPHELASEPCATPSPEDHSVSDSASVASTRVTGQVHVSTLSPNTVAETARLPAPVKTMSDEVVKENEHGAASLRAATPRRRTLFQLGGMASGEEPSLARPVPAPSSVARDHAEVGPSASAAESPSAPQATGSAAQVARQPRRNLWTSLRAINPF